MSPLTNQTSKILFVSGPNTTDYQNHKCDIVPPDKTENKNDDKKSDVSDVNDGQESATIDNCATLFGDPKVPGSPAYYISFAFRLMKYIGIVLLLALSIIDFVKAVTSQDNDQLKKATGTTLKRLIACIVIFLLPVLIDLIMVYTNEEALSKCKTVDIVENNN